MANWSNPTLTSTYSNFLADLKARDEDLAKQFDGQTVSNLVTGAIRWNSSINRWQKWDGTSWGELASTYALTGLSTTGAASIGGALTVTGAAALNGGATTTTAATGDNSTTVATTAFVKAQAYATLASPALTGTPTAPTAALGTNTTQLATCAYVNSEIANDALLKTGGTLTGALQVPSGTVGANGLQVGAAGTGIYSPGAGIAALASAGTEVLRVTAALGLALGSTSANANVGFRHAKSITGGTTAWAQFIDGTVQSDVTTSAIGIGTSLSTAGSQSITTLVHYQAAAGTFGASTSLTNQIGFSASSTLDGATNDYGFYGAIAAGTGNWNCFMVGAAPNYFAGQVQLGAGSTGTPSLSTNGDTDSGLYFPAAGQVALVTNGALSLLSDDNGDLSIYNAAGTFSHRFANQPTADRTITLPDANVTLVSGTMVPTTGSGATGTWGINVTGSAASWTTGRTISLTGSVTGTSGAFNGTGDLSFSTAIAANAVGSTQIANGAVGAGKLSGSQSGSAPLYGARAWVNFNGTGTVAIAASGNVSSISDNTTGDYTVNFSTAMPTASYCMCGTGEGNATYGASNIGMVSKRASVAFTTAGARVLTGEGGTGSAVPRDMSVISVAFFC